MENINETPEQEEVQNVGEILRNSRLKKGKTLSDISEELCIRRVYLEAIENVEYQKLPPQPYGLGYVRNYANYLGLNSDRIVQIFRETAFEKNDNHKNSHLGGHNHNKETSPRPKHLLISVLLLLALGLAWSFYSPKKDLNDSQNTTTLNVLPIEEPVIIEEEKINIDEDSSSTSEETTEPENANENQEVTIEDIDAKDSDSQQTADQDDSTLIDENAPRVKLVCTGSSWIEIKHADKIILTGTYNKGFSYEIPYNQDIYVSIGKRHNVQFYIDGKLTDIINKGKQTGIKLDNFLQKR